MSSRPALRRAGRAASALLVAAAFIAVGAPGARAQDDTGPYVPGRVLVKFKNGVTKARARAIVHAHGGVAAAQLSRIDVWMVNVPPNAEEHAFADNLRGDGRVDFVELDKLWAPDTTPNDTYFNSQWHLSKIQAPTAWSTTTGSSGVTIAILDTGVDGTHPDLAAKMVAGWNFYDNTSDTHDVYGHGTAVAGSAAAATNNGTGVAGVAWGCNIMPIRVSDLNGYGSTSAMASGLTFAADHGARVANISYRVSTSATVTSAAQYMQNHGGVVCVSSGNETTFVTTADNPYILTVGATSSSDALCSWSNTGNNLDLVAPGCGIYTTNRGGGYGSWSGTSFSSPITAGVAALVISANPNLTGAQVMQTILSSTDDLGAAGWDTTFGAGRLNAAAAVALATGSSSSSTTTTTTTTTPAPAPTPDTTAPTITIKAPTDGAVVTGNISVTVAASDDVAVTKVELWVDGVLKATSTTTPFTTKWNTKTAKAGAHGLLCKAYDAAGNSTSSVPVQVVK